ncbi:hypothetical protein BKA70DRAFT_1409367 [Coprinopsis sp. MPI-PUGE-AT-0042]|nr:hypothetical protein BKA70DRAFT_1409367 [Coprinopsis sp. MPI-PUGE-AT-0042]
MLASSHHEHAQLVAAILLKFLVLLCAPDCDLPPGSSFEYQGCMDTCDGGKRRLSAATSLGIEAAVQLVRRTTTHRRAFKGEKEERDWEKEAFLISPQTLNISTWYSLNPKTATYAAPVLPSSISPP